MDTMIRSVLIEPHTDLYDYAIAHAAPMPFVVWPSVVLGVVVTYLLAIKVILPAYMAGRKPYDLRRTMLAYNALQLLANLYLGYGLTAEILRQGENITTGCIFSTPGLVRLHLLWIINKYTDLIETVFFVLRQKYSQVSILHLYHHVVVIYYTYMAFVENAGGYAVFSGAMNSFVHAVMYAYYFASIYDRQMVARLINYKRRITQIQMVQFLINMLYFLKSSVNVCRFPRYLSYSGVVQNGVLFYLFANFYYHAYYKKRALKAK